MSERGRGNPTEHEAQHPGELTEAEEAELVRRVARMQEQMANNIAEWVDTVAKQGDVPATELLAMTIKMSALWKDFVLDLLKIEPSTYERIVLDHGKRED